MQTWLAVHVPSDPIATYRESAAVLDDRRLRAQANEAKVILRVASGWTLDGGKVIPWAGRGWANVALTRAWRPWVWSLALYGEAMSAAMCWRGMKPGPDLAMWFYSMAWKLDRTPHPPWLGMVAPRCRANLLAKDPAHYGQFDWTETPGIEPIWPDIADTYGQRAA